MFELLDAEEATDTVLTDTYAMMPAAAVNGWYFAHPASKYFNVGKVERDQIESIAARKQLSLEEMERWLNPVLAYTPS